MLIGLRPKEEFAVLNPESPTSRWTVFDIELIDAITGDLLHAKATELPNSSKDTCVNTTNQT